MLGAAAMLVAGAAVATVGFFAAPAPAPEVAPQAVDSQSGQLGTLPLHDEKPMRGIGKGVPSP